jgi:hypothetical protein
MTNPRTGPVAGIRKFLNHHDDNWKARQLDYPTRRHMINSSQSKPSERRRAVLNHLMVVTVLPAVRPGPRFDPNTLDIASRTS